MQASSARTPSSLKRIVQRLREWTRVDAAMVFRTYRYWKATKDLGVLMYGGLADIPVLVVEIEVDSDHGNDKFSARSTASHWGVISGPRTYAPTTWASKGNPSTGRNTAGVEAVSIDRGTFVHAIPLAATELLD